MGTCDQKLQFSILLSESFAFAKHFDSKVLSGLSLVALAAPRAWG